MINYDIGIQTLWNIPNYGTYVQAYALQKVIESLSNRETVQIAHLDKKHYNFYYDYKNYLRSRKVLSKPFIKSIFYKNDDTSQKLRIFSEAYDRIPHTEIIDESNILKYSFKKVFLGSDILWDYSLEPFNHDTFLFGNDFKSEINSYAASFGTVDLGDNYPNYVVKALKEMKNVSVRDDKSASIVEDIIGYRPPVVLDPTWLWDFCNDKNIINPDKSEYILVYGQDFTTEFIRNLIEFSKKEKLPIIALDCNSDNYDWCYKLVRQSELDPFLWIGYFKNAKYIATSTFHGLTFSLIFKKRFAFCKTDFIMAKAERFLNELEILDKFQEKNDVYGMIESDWNYEFIESVINKKRQVSISFLRKALED